MMARPEEDSLVSRFRGCLVGLAVGDALGAPVEGMSRAEIRRIHGRLQDMVGGGWHGLEPGHYTDDAAMMLCIARSIAAKGCFDAGDVAGRFIRWFEAGPVGIGRTTWIAISELKRGAPWRDAGKTTHDRLGGKSAGNGSIMRCAPIGLLHCDRSDRLVQDSIDSSLITHWDAEACWGAVAVNAAIARILRGLTCDFLSRTAEVIEQPRVKEAVRQVAGMETFEDEPSAYVLDTLRAALWSFVTTSSFEEAVVTAVNLGGDTDTVGAVCGALAGARYGIEAIPQRWLEPLQSRDEIVGLADRIHELAGA